MANGDFASTISGAASGAGQGAQVGSMIPGVGTAIGAGVGALIGGGSAYMKNKKANQSQDVALVDPMEENRLSELNQLRKSITAGTDPLTQNAMRENNALNRSTQNVIARNSGGNVSATMEGLLRSQSNAQKGINQIQANSQNQIPFYENAATSLSSRMAQRRLELGLLKRAQETAENAQGRKENNVNANALMAVGQEAFGGDSGMGQRFQDLTSGMMANRGLSEVPNTQTMPEMPRMGNAFNQYIPVTGEQFSPEQIASFMPSATGGFGI